MDSVFVLSTDGECLIEHYASGPQGTGRAAAEEVMSELARGRPAPENVRALQQGYAFHAQQGQLVYLCTAQSELAPLVALEFLGFLADACQEYLGADCGPADLRESAVLVYQLLDEMLDAGYPSVTEMGQLKAAVPPPRLLTKMANALRITTQGAPAPADSASNIPWRQQGIRHASNEVYVDVVEELDVTFDCEGAMTNLGIYGELCVQSKLSHTPEVMIVFANPDLFEECRFHPCVRYVRYASDRLLSFVPPDGAFKLMSYKVAPRAAKGLTATVLPFYVKPQVSYSDQAGKISIMVGMKADLSKTPEQVGIKIPLPHDASHADMSVNHGAVTVDIAKHQAVWLIGKLKKDKPSCLNAVVTINPTSGSPAQSKAGSRRAKGGKRSAESPTFEVSFQLQGTALSGATVSSMEVSNVKYKPYKGVRYITRSGFFEIRT